MQPIKRKYTPINKDNDSILDINSVSTLITPPSTPPSTPTSISTPQTITDDYLQSLHKRQKLNMVFPQPSLSRVSTDEVAQILNTFESLCINASAESHYASIAMSPSDLVILQRSSPNIPIPSNITPTNLMNSDSFEQLCHTIPDNNYSRSTDKPPTLQEKLSTPSLLTLEQFLLLNNLSGGGNLDDVLSAQNTHNESNLSNNNHNNHNNHDISHFNNPPIEPPLRSKPIKTYKNSNNRKNINNSTMGMDDFIHIYNAQSTGNFALNMSFFFNEPTYSNTTVHTPYNPGLNTHDNLTTHNLFSTSYLYQTNTFDTIHQLGMKQRVYTMLDSVDNDHSSNVMNTIYEHR